jgi:hypothetical protein
MEPHPFGVVEPSPPDGNAGVGVGDTSHAVSSEGSAATGGGGSDLTPKRAGGAALLSPSQVPLIEKHKAAAKDAVSPAGRVFSSRGMDLMTKFKRWKHEEDAKKPIRDFRCVCAPVLLCSHARLSRTRRQCLGVQHASSRLSCAACLQDCRAADSTLHSAVRAQSG